ncbi:MAG: hypothetical protein ACLTER_11345, partial [Ruminococcus sp.]
DDLNLRLEAASQWGKGFKIVIFFSKIETYPENHIYRKTPADFLRAGSVVSAILKGLYCYSLIFL